MKAGNALFYPVVFPHSPQVTSVSFALGVYFYGFKEASGQSDTIGSRGHKTCGITRKQRNMTDEQEPGENTAKDLGRQVTCDFYFVSLVTSRQVLERVCFVSPCDFSNKRICNMSQQKCLTSLVTSQVWSRVSTFVGDSLLRDQDVVGPRMLSSQNGLHHGRHHACAMDALFHGRHQSWAMDALFSERIRPPKSSCLGVGEEKQPNLALT